MAHLTACAMTHGVILGYAITCIPKAWHVALSRVFAGSACRVPDDDAQLHVERLAEHLNVLGQHLIRCSRTSVINLANAGQQSCIACTTSLPNMLFNYSHLSTYESGILQAIQAAQTSICALYACAVISPLFWSTTSKKSESFPCDTPGSPWNSLYKSRTCDAHKESKPPRPVTLTPQQVPALERR